jgi:hypothetical protein
VNGRANDSGHRARPSRWPNGIDLLSEESDLLLEESDLVSIDFVPRAVAGVPVVGESSS